MRRISRPPWQQYRRPFVRDLAYALACPPVLAHWVDHQPLLNTPKVTIHGNDFWQAQFDAYQTRLQQLDDTHLYQKLTRFLMTRPSPYRLGFHFEGLIHYWLIDGFKFGCHPYEVLAHNVQLYRGKQTTGELDFIIRNHYSDQIEHWELAIKFFVGTPPYAFENWVGLNSRDNLQLKMTHMHTKQFKVVWVDSKEHGKLKIDKRVGVIKGRFFKPISDTTFARPDWLTRQFILHDWIDGEQPKLLNELLNELPKQDSHSLGILRKAHYIEWFTKRDFYDQRYGVYQYNLSQLTQASSLNTGLYFLNDNPIVIYRENRDRIGDKY